MRIFKIENIYKLQYISTFLLYPLSMIKNYRIFYLKIYDFWKLAAILYEKQIKIQYFYFNYIKLILNDDQISFVLL